MKLCPHCNSKAHRYGTFWVKHRRLSVQRYSCQKCQRTFSSQTLATTAYYKKTHLIPFIFRLLCNGNSQRAVGRSLLISKDTVHKYFLHLTAKATQFKATPTPIPVTTLYFDELESIEHTKLKPLCIALAISQDYKIVAIEVGKLKAKGHLAKISRLKYGFRQDESFVTCHKALLSAATIIQGQPLKVRTDKKPSYKGLLTSIFPTSIHEAFDRKIDEEPFLKYNKKRFDPLFPLNQRCAKLRSDIKRLTRRSWCTTKKVENLQRHLDLYMAYNNGWQIA
jgi:transposase-like protein